MFKITMFISIVLSLPILAEEKNYKLKQLYPVLFLYALVIFVSMGQWEGEGFVCSLQVCCLAASGKLLIGAMRQAVCSLCCEIGSIGYWKAYAVDFALSIIWTSFLISFL